MDRKLTWQEHYDLVREYVDEYLNDADVRELMPGNVEFDVANYSDAFNACVQQLTEQDYRIVFAAGLVKRLTREARLIVEHSPLIFRGLDRSNEDLVGKCHIWLMFNG